jgi:hypothetical protein
MAFRTSPLAVTWQGRRIGASHLTSTLTYHQRFEPQFLHRFYAHWKSLVPTHTNYPTWDAIREAFLGHRRNRQPYRRHPWVKDHSLLASRAYRSHLTFQIVELHNGVSLQLSSYVSSTGQRYVL